MLYLVSSQYDPASFSSISFLLMCCYCYLIFCIGHQSSYFSKVHWNQQITRALKFGQFHCAFFFLVPQKKWAFLVWPTLCATEFFSASVRSRRYSVVAKNFCALVDVRNDGFIGSDLFAIECNASRLPIHFKSEPCEKSDYLLIYLLMVCSWPKFVSH